MKPLFDSWESTLRIARVSLRGANRVLLAEETAQLCPRQALREAQLLSRQPTVSLPEPTGLLLEPTGLLNEPPGLLIEPQGLLIEPQGLLIEPPGLLIEPQGLLIEPQGLLCGLKTLSRLAERTLNNLQGLLRN